MSHGGEWWRGAVVYTVYPLSFADSNGDGIGDLGGVRSHLDYVADLGVDAIWLTPFYPSPLVDGGYDVRDHVGVDPRMGTLADFDALVADAAARRIRVLVDLVPNHCSDRHPLFRQALAAGPGSAARERFLFRNGRGPGGGRPPNNWQSEFGGPAWTRITEPDGTPGQWYLHLFDPRQPDWNWRHPGVRSYFDDVIRFWLDRGVAGLRIDVAHGLFKDPEMADVGPEGAPDSGPYYHRPELHELYRSWRAILDSYPADVFPGRRTAIGEVWCDTLETLGSYLGDGGLPQVFNFQLAQSRWHPGGLFGLLSFIDASVAMTEGCPSAAPWVLANHDVTRTTTRFGMLDPCDPVVPGVEVDEALGVRRARAAALLLLALPGSAYLYQGEELGLPEVLDLPPQARTDPVFARSGGADHGRDGCRVPLPWSGSTPPYGFSSAVPAPGLPSPPQPHGWGSYTVAAQRRDSGSTLNLYRAALALRRAHPALGEGHAGGKALTWLDGPHGTLIFRRRPGFVFAVNMGARPVRLPQHDEILLASGPIGDETLPPDTAVWLACPEPGEGARPAAASNSSAGERTGP